MMRYLTFLKKIITIICHAQTACIGTVMKTHQRVILWSAVLSVGIAFFWINWMLHSKTSVPTVSAFQLTKKLQIQFPVAISRWWDILAGPIIVVATTYILSWSKTIRTPMDTVQTLLAGCALVGFCYGLIVYGIIVGILIGLATEVIGMIVSILFVILQRSSGGDADSY